MKTKQQLSKILSASLFAAALFFSSSAVFAQVKIGTAPTTIDPANNLEVEASTAGRKTSIDKTTGKVTIADGSQGVDKVFTSNVNGVGTWQNAKLTAFAGAVSQVRQTMVQSAGPSTMTTVVFQNETADPTNSFNPATGVFTAPMSGLYQVFGSTQFDNNAIAGIPVFYSACLKIFINGGLGGQSCSQINVVTSSASVSNIVRLNAGDSVTLVAGATVASGSTFGIVVSSFYAYRIAD